MFHVIIPARFGSTRLPGKPLLMIGDRPLIQWVWQSARDSGAASVVVATDDERIRAAAMKFGAECLMTSPRHASGTDRIAEVSRARQWADDDIVVNLQGDEPGMPGEVIARVASALQDDESSDIATAVAPIQSLREFLDPNCVKALRSEDGQALYFSRAPVPWPRDSVAAGQPTSFAGAWRHIGLYAYRVRSLLQFAAWPPTPLESTEKLEQLRALEHGMRIHLVRLTESPPAGVDTAADLERVRATLPLR
ncbi:MAG: 3-deoxy-manno-octulosonate cytidylyltransferase synthetase [Gammaproteobacteria bacterium]|jgi:3-deoxy-manno-octulosonate cytidylyltransferase (CMP-KDO synthetase)|nr:3-deoxy-manno-octulosonate cytidylyltransferase synthetase [Gammaproteobacteria bacterium]